MGRVRNHPAFRPSDLRYYSDLKFAVSHPPILTVGFTTQWCVYR